MDSGIKHIAFIMDGNGRWAKERGLPRYKGHEEGCINSIEVFNACKEFGIKVVTLYAFSTENWSRPQQEKLYLFGYIEKFFNEYIDTFMKDGVKFRIMGDAGAFPQKTRKVIERAQEMTKDNKNYVLNIGLNYGGRQEIVKATKEIAQDVESGKLKIEDIDEKLFASHLYTADLPEVDLMIRTSGEQRLSNYLLYQLAYSEFIFTKTYWPDFSKEELRNCISEYQTRNRRFGKV